MASYRQRGGKWQARVLRNAYPDQTKTFEAKADAEKWARSVESEIDKGRFISINEAQRTTMGDLIERRKPTEQERRQHKLAGGVREVLVSMSN